MLFMVVIERKLGKRRRDDGGSGKLFVGLGMVLFISYVCGTTECTDSRMNFMTPKDDLEEQPGC